jgi:SulP family sulfate permease
VCKASQIWRPHFFWAITLALTVFADLTVAVEAGMLCSALVYAQSNRHDDRDSRDRPICRGRLATQSSRQADSGIRGGIPNHGQFLFGANEKISQVAECLNQLPPIVILRLRNMTAIDATGLQAMEDMGQEMPRHTSDTHLVRCAAAASKTYAAGGIRTVCWLG